MCAQYVLDTVQLLLVVFSLPSASANTPLALVVMTSCNLRCWCFPFEALALLLMCTQMNRHILQLALCGGMYSGMGTRASGAGLAGPRFEEGPCF